MSRKMRECRSRVALVLALTIGILQIGCDPGRTIRSEDAVPDDVSWAATGVVVNATTGETIPGAHVEVLGIGSGITDAEGMYHLGKNVSISANQKLVIRAQAAGFSPGHREVRVAADRLEIPAMYLVPTAQSVRLGEQGGVFVFQNGATIRVPAGAVRGTTQLAVTILPEHGPGMAHAGEGMAGVGAFYVSADVDRFEKPIEVTIPLKQRIAPLTTVSLLIYETSEHAWKEVATSRISPDGATISTDVQSENLYVYTDGDYSHYQSRQTATPQLVTTHGSWQLIGECLGEGPVMSGDFTYEKLYGSYGLERFPSFDNYLWSMYGGRRTYPSHQIATIPERMRLTMEKRAEFVVETRHGEVWHQDNPADKAAYEYFHTTFVQWETRVTKNCDPQGIIA